MDDLHPLNLSQLFLLFAFLFAYMCGSLSSRIRTMHATGELGIMPEVGAQELATTVASKPVASDGKRLLPQ